MTSGHRTRLKLSKGLISRRKEKKEKKKKGTEERERDSGLSWGTKKVASYQMRLTPSGM